MACDEMKHAKEDAEKHNVILQTELTHTQKKGDNLTQNISHSSHSNDMHMRHNDLALNKISEELNKEKQARRETK